MERQIPLCFMTFVYGVLKNTTGYHHYIDILDVLTEKEQTLEEYAISKLFNGQRKSVQLEEYFKELADHREEELKQRFRKLKFQNLQYVVSVLRILVFYADLDEIIRDKLLEIVGETQEEEKCYEFITEVFRYALSCPKEKSRGRLSAEDKEAIREFQKMALEEEVKPLPKGKLNSQPAERLNPLTSYFLKVSRNHVSYAELCYDAETVEFVGREEELRELQNFCRDERDILWWALTGDGGHGKSRLAYEFMKEQNQARDPDDGIPWIAKDISWSDFYSYHSRNCIDLISWESPFHMLFIVDYVSVYENEIGRWIQWLLQSKKKGGTKVRVLLIERGVLRRDYLGNEFIPVWFKNFRAGWSNQGLLKHSCYSEKFLQLNQFDFDAGIRILKSYCGRKGILIGEESCRTLMEFVKEIDPQMSPLIILCVADAWMEQKNLFYSYVNWNREKILGFIIEREKQQIYSICNDTMIADIVIELQMIATIVGKVKLNGNFYQRLFSLPHFSIYEHHLGQVISKISNLSRYTNGVLVGIEPDLIGEYFVYTVLKEQYEESDTAALFAFLQELFPENVARFLERFNNDFYILIRHLPGYYELRQMMSSDKSMVFSIINEQGKEVQCEVLFTFDEDDDDEGKRYVVYTDNSVNAEGMTHVFAATYQCSEDEFTPEAVLSPITTEWEFEMIAMMLNELKKQAETISEDGDFDRDLVVKKVNEYKKEIDKKTIYLGLHAEITGIDAEERKITVKDVDGAEVFQVDEETHDSTESGFNGLLAESCEIDCNDAIAENRLICADLETGDSAVFPFEKLEAGDSILFSLRKPEFEKLKEGKVKAYQIQLVMASGIAPEEHDGEMPVLDFTDW